VQLQIIAKPSDFCCQLANTNVELGGLAAAILAFAELIWFLLLLVSSHLFIDDIKMIKM